MTRLSEGNKSFGESGKAWKKWTKNKVGQNIYQIRFANTLHVIGDWQLKLSQHDWYVAMYDLCAWDGCVRCFSTYIETFWFWLLSWLCLLFCFCFLVQKKRDYWNELDNNIGKPSHWLWWYDSNENSPSVRAFSPQKGTLDYCLNCDKFRQIVASTRPLRTHAMLYTTDTNSDTSFRGVLSRPDVN